MNKLNNQVDPKDPVLNEIESSEINESANEDMDLDMEIEAEDGMMNDIVIEIDDEDIDLLNSSDVDISVEDDIKLEETDDLVEDDDDPILSKHKIQGKHSLKYDSIFKGKKEDPLSDEEFDTMSSYYNDNFEVDKGSIFWFESMDNENYIKEKRIKEKVYEVLLNNTDLNFLNNRRKPSKSDFNNYYFLIKTNLKGENFTNTEIFNELAVYFSDNLFNMFKLLDDKWRKLIIDELRDHVGRYNTNPEVTVKNINIGTEVEFSWDDIILEEKLIITGVVIEVDDSLFIVDSYEKIYHLELDQITKILNNNKFKYNLNKLDNIDFL
jgi:hypothetical protein